MPRSQPPRPPVPPPAERARALVQRAARAAMIAGAEVPTDPEHLTDAGDGLRVVPNLHHVPATGAATLQLPADHPVVLLVRDRGATQLPVMLELGDVAPVEVRQPVRGLVWISGRLRLLPLRVARRAALRIAGEHPDERLLDVGHGDVLLRLDPTMIVLSDAEGTEMMAPATMAAAPADPLADAGDRWLAHLASAHAGVLGGLVHRLPPGLRSPGHRLAPLGVDRLGIRLRVETPRGDHDVRLAFAEPVSCPRRLGAEVQRLAGCTAELPEAPGLTEAPRRAAGA
jgi:hypothetical protein